MNFVISLLITGVLYMILPLIYVKFRGKTTSGKAFGLAFLNWIILHAIFLAVYYSIFPDDTSAATIGPALWLFVAWRYMTIKDTTKHVKINTTSMQLKNKKSIPKSVPNSIEDLENKFHLNFKNTYRETFNRDTLRFALFIFRMDRSDLQIGQLTAVVVVNIQQTNFRYFAVEKSFGKSYLLCELIFDNQNTEIKHLNYGGVYESEFDSKTQTVVVGNEVLIDQIHTIIRMKVEPEATSVKSKLGWNTTMKKVDKDFEENMQKILDKMKKNI